MIKVVVLDFDGVIVDSNALKERAFYDLFPGAGEVHALIKTVLSDNRYGTRLDILREILEGQGKRASEIEALVPVYAAQYNNRVQQGILEVGVSRDVRATLTRLSHRYRLYLNSGTYAPALSETVENLNIGHFFQKAYGRPPFKEENLREILTFEKAFSREVVVVGDGEEDYQSATALHCPFIAIANGFNDWGKRPVLLASSLLQVPELVASIESAQVSHES